MTTEVPTTGPADRLFAAAAALAALLGGSTCLAPDFDGDCGAGEPECFKGEICIDGTCQPKNRVPDERLDASADGTSPDADTDLAPRDADGRSDGADSGDAADAAERCPYAGEEDTGVCSGLVPVNEGECPEIPFFEEDGSEPTCDGLDNDCDGRVDENCPCEEGAIYDCYTGREEFAGRGQCRWGEQSGCGPDGFRFRCEGGDGRPESETCEDELDNDCDGVTDEGCPCVYTPGEGDGGVCRNQTIAPDGTCPEPENFEPTETSCDDDMDNDCDGSTDSEDDDCDSD